MSSPSNSPVTTMSTDSQQDANLRIRIPRTTEENVSDEAHSVTSSDTEHSTPHDDSETTTSHDPRNTNAPLPPPTIPSLRRDLNTLQWKGAYDKYTKLYTEYMVWKTLTYALPLYIISISVSTIQYFTKHEFYWFCVGFPICGMIGMMFLYNKLLFTRKQSPMVNMFSYYPGDAYEFGVVVKVNYNYYSPEFRDYEFWVVHNSYSNAPDFIYIQNESYNTPHVCDMLLTH